MSRKHNFLLIDRQGERNLCRYLLILEAVDG